MEVILNGLGGFSNHEYPYVNCCGLRQALIKNWKVSRKEGRGLLWWSGRSSSMCVVKRRVYWSLQERRISVLKDLPGARVSSEE